MATGRDERPLPRPRRPAASSQLLIYGGGRLRPSRGRGQSLWTREGPGLSATGDAGRPGRLWTPRLPRHLLYGGGRLVRRDEAEGFGQTAPACPTAGDEWQTGAVKGLGGSWRATDETTLRGGPSAVLARAGDHALVDHRDRLPTQALSAGRAAELLDGPECCGNLGCVHGQTAAASSRAAFSSSSLARRWSNSPAITPSKLAICADSWPGSPAIWGTFARRTHKDVPPGCVLKWPVTPTCEHGSPRPEARSRSGTVGCATPSTTPGAAPDPTPRRRVRAPFLQGLPCCDSYRAGRSPATGHEVSEVLNTPSTY